jgi:hypothetical protein
MEPLLRSKYELLLKVLKKEVDQGNVIEFKEYVGGI